MATQTSLVAQQVRLKQWAEQIRDCQNRPEGMDVKTWCSQNNITKANYYYRLRRVRAVYLDQIQDTASAFVELSDLDKDGSSPAPDVQHSETPQKEIPVIRLQNNKGLSAEIFSNISTEMLRHIIEVFNHAE